VHTWKSAAAKTPKGSENAANLTGFGFRHYHLTMTTNALTPAQLKVYEVIQRTRMAWTLLIIVLVCFVGVLVALILAAFSPTVGPSMRWAFGIIDGLLVITLHRIVGFLFPGKK
jgi:hypothetical protein